MRPSCKHRCSRPGYILGNIAWVTLLGVCVPLAAGDDLALASELTKQPAVKVAGVVTLVGVYWCSAWALDVWRIRDAGASGWLWSSALCYGVMLRAALWIVALWPIMAIYLSQSSQTRAERILNHELATLGSAENGLEDDPLIRSASEKTREAIKATIDVSYGPDWERQMTWGVWYAALLGPLLVCPHLWKLTVARSRNAGPDSPASDKA